MGQRSSTRNSVNKALRKMAHRKGANPQRGDSWRKPKAARPPDKLVTQSIYTDTGCDVSPSCLACPLPACKYDDMAGYRRWKAMRATDAVRTIRWRVAAPCARCGKATKPGRLYCGGECLAAARAVKRPTITCAFCGKSVYRSPSEIAKFSRHFCSLKCLAKTKRTDARRRIVCEVCGKEREAYREARDRGWGRFCGLVCSGKAKRRHPAAPDVDRVAYAKIARRARAEEHKKRPAMMEARREAMRRWREKPENREKMRLANAAYRASFSPEWKAVLAARKRRARARARKGSS